MNRIFQCRPLLSEAISQSLRVRQGHTFTAFALSRNYDPHVAYHLKHFKNGSKFLCCSHPSYFHTSRITLNQEPLQASTEKSETTDEKQSSSQFDEVSENDNERNQKQCEVQTENFGEVASQGGGEGTVIDRLRRLSMTDADDYELSEVAQQKAREMSKVRAETIKRGEQWKWDQKNLRPGGSAPRQYGYGGGGGYNRRENDYGARRNRYDDEEYDDYEPERTWRQGSYNNNRRSGSFKPRFNAPEYEDGGRDEPEDYELEMQKLRERMQQNKKAVLSSQGSNQESGNERNNILNISSSSKYEHSETRNSSSFDDTEKPSIPDEYNETNLNEHKKIDHFDYSPDYQVDFTLVEKDTDTFGNLSFATSSLVKDDVGEAIRDELLRDEKSLSFKEEDEEEDDMRFIPPYGEKWTTQKLITKVRSLLKEKKLKEAVDTFLGVLKEGGFHFDDDELRHQFNVLINECANVGYVEMSFRLYNLMKKRGYKDKWQTISSLLNAVANSPWDKERNLERIDKLLINMKDRERELNLINYHALIKAYGRLGETVRAFNVVDTMIEESKKPVTSTFNMLLQACISDTKNGFRYALLTWKKLQTMGMGKMRPDIYSYNLLLRAVRDCGIELEEINANRKAIPDSATNHRMISPPVPMLPPIVTDEDRNRLLNFLILENTTAQETKIVIENLGDPTIVDVKDLMVALSYPQNRLAVLGGLRGVLSQMVRHKVAPNLKTLTVLLDVSRAVDINDILQLLNTYKIKPDQSFFNMAIKQCYKLNQDKMAEDILKIMNNVYHLSPNIVTWGVLSLGCRTWLEAKTLLTDMENTNFTPDVHIFGSLLSSAFKSYDPRYVLHLMEEIKRREVPLSDMIILQIDEFISRTQRGIVSHEMGKEVENSGLSEALESNPDFAEHFRLLKMRYNQWIESVDVKVLPENPWKEDFKHFRANMRHKPNEPEDLQYLKSITASEERV